MEADTPAASLPPPDLREMPDFLPFSALYMGALFFPFHFLFHSQVADGQGYTSAPCHRT